MVGSYDDDGTQMGDEATAMDTRDDDEDDDEVGAALRCARLLYRAPTPPRSAPCLLCHRTNSQRCPALQAALPRLGWAPPLLAAGATVSGPSPNPPKYIPASRPHPLSSVLSPVYRASLLCVRCRSLRPGARRRRRRWWRSTWMTPTTSTWRQWSCRYSGTAVQRHMVVRQDGEEKAAAVAQRGRCWRCSPRGFVVPNCHTPPQA